MDTNLYKLALTKGKFKDMADFINSLEPCIDCVQGIENAVRWAFQQVECGEQMSIKFLNGVYKHFFNCETIYYRENEVIITAPTNRHRSIHKSGRVDFSELLSWMARFNQYEGTYENAALLYRDFWFLQPTSDGNKRAAMILIVAFCHKHRLPVPYLPQSLIMPLKIALFDDNIELIASMFLENA